MLQIEGLHTHYGAAHILHGVTMLVEAGTSVGLLGRNGMGKTTLIRSLMGYVKPTEGRIQWNDREVTGARARTDGAPRHRLRAGRPRRVPEPVGAREPRDGRAPGCRRTSHLDPRAGALDVPAPRRAPRPRRPAAVGRRAADAVDRPRADDQSAAPDPRRGDRGPRAARRRRDLARDRRDPRDRHRDPGRRPRPPQGQREFGPARRAAEGPRRAGRAVRARCATASA